MASPKPSPAAPRGVAAPTPVPATRARAAVASGADSLVASGFRALAGKRVGLITNQTGLVASGHLADELHQARGVTLAAIFAPEHGFRGGVEAGDKVADDRDPRTGVKVFSLYGATRKPTAAMLRDIDVLVFDIQDIGARFYTYISTMGLAMQAAAAQRLPFVVLDRPNPLGGHYVSGFVREAALSSFVGQYPIPIVHGLSVGELARMIQGERWLDGLGRLDLTVIPMRGWRREMRWPETRRTWVATSPNIPTFETALVYPGIGIVGETLVNEGRGTAKPFTVFGAPWFDGRAMARELNAVGLGGVRFEAASYTPRSIPNVATNPRFLGERIEGVRLRIDDVAAIAPLEIGMHALALVARQARARGVPKLFGNLPMFHAIAGTKRLHRMVSRGADGHTIVAGWRDEVAAFTERRVRYLQY